MAQKTVTANGNAQLDTADFKYGTASGLFDGDTDYLTTPNNAVWDLTSTASWTIDFWIKPNGAQGNYDGVIQRGAAPDPWNGWAIQFCSDSGHNANDIRICNNSNGTGGVFSTSNLSTAWHHVAFVHNDSNDTLKVYIDGTENASATASTAINWTNTSDLLYIGMQNGFTGRSFNGWLDGVRITKGVARWTANFTPPTEAEEHTYDANNELLLHCNGADASTTFTDDSANSGDAPPSGGGSSISSYKSLLGVGQA